MSTNETQTETLADGVVDIARLGNPPQRLNQQTWYLPIPALTRTMGVPRVTSARIWRGEPLRPHDQGEGDDGREVSIQGLV